MGGRDLLLENVRFLGGATLGSVAVRDGLVAETPTPDACRFDAGGAVVAAAFVDLQINGGFGLDFTEEPESIWEVAARLPRFGVSGFLPTLVSPDPETVEHARDVLRTGPPPGWRGARPLGLHCEGPMLAPSHRGAHRPEALRTPSPALTAGWAPPEVRMVTLAPELDGALEVAASLRAVGVVVAAGHSGASVDVAEAAFAAGVTHVTHLFNAMSGLHHRTPSLAAAALSSPTVTAGIIPDGVHVHPVMVKLAWTVLGRDRLVPVTDAVAPMGVDGDASTLAGSPVVVTDRGVFDEDGRLAGSVVPFDQAVRNLMAFTGASLPEAVVAAAVTPRRVLGLAVPDPTTPGSPADFVLLDDDAQVVATVVAGEIVHERR